MATIDNKILSQISYLKTKKLQFYEDFIKVISAHHFRFQPILLFEENSFDCRNNRIEEWSQNLWNEIIEFIKFHKSYDKSKHYSSKSLINLFDIHIIIGSKRGLMRIVDPFIYSHKKDIIEQHNLKNGSKEKNLNVNVNEEDKFTCYAQEYLDAELKEEKNQKERDKLLTENGISELNYKNKKPMEPSIVLIDPAKLNPGKVSSTLGKTLGDNKGQYQKMIFLCLGYSYGVKAKEIAKQLFLLFGKRIKSFSLLGKATDLSSGKAKLLFANKITNYENSETISIETAHISANYLNALGKKNTEIGEVLTLNVRVFQNDILLDYYGKVCDCLAGEMEAFYYAKQIKQLQDNDLVDLSLYQTYGYFIEEENKSEVNSYDFDASNSKDSTSNQNKQDFNTGFIELSALYHFIFIQITSLSNNAIPI